MIVSGSFDDRKEYMKCNKSYCLRNIGKTYFLVSSDEFEKDENELILLNETSAFLWEEMGKSCSVDDLVKAIINQYDVAESIAYKHVADFISFLSENGCLDLE